MKALPVYLLFIAALVCILSLQTGDALADRWYRHDSNPNCNHETRHCPNLEAYKALRCNLDWGGENLFNHLDYVELDFLISIEEEVTRWPYYRRGTDSKMVFVVADIEVYPRRIRMRHRLLDAFISRTDLTLEGKIDRIGNSPLEVLGACKFISIEAVLRPVFEKIKVERQIQNLL